MRRLPLFLLLTNRDLTRVWWAGLISWTGNYALFVALPVYVYGRTNSTLATALSVMAGTLPSVVVGPLAGVLVDRWDRRRVLVLANLTLSAATPLFLLAPDSPWWLAVPIALVQSSLGQFLGPAEHALLPTLVGEEHLAAANSLNALNNNLARLIGPAAGGLLLASLGFAGVVIADALTYLLAAGLMWGVRAPESAPQPEGTRRVLGEWRAGLAMVGGNALLRLCFVAAGLVGFGEGFISTLMAPFVKEMLGGGGRELGFLLSAQAVGGILAGLLLASFAHRLDAARLLGWGGLLSGLSLAALLNYPLLYPALWPGLVLVAVAGLPFAAWGTAQTTLLQRESDDDKRGRVFGSYLAVFGLTQLLGMGASGYLGDKLGVLVINVDTAMYLLAGAAVLLSIWHKPAERASRTS